MNITIRRTPALQQMQQKVMPMTDRYSGLIVVLEEDIRSDDAEPVIAAISQMRGVLKVKPLVSEPVLYIAKQRARAELRQKVKARDEQIRREEREKADAQYANEAVRVLMAKEGVRQLVLKAERAAMEKACRAVCWSCSKGIEHPAAPPPGERPFACTAIREAFQSEPLRDRPAKS